VEGVAGSSGRGVTETKRGSDAHARERRAGHAPCYGLPVSDRPDWHATLSLADVPFSIRVRGESLAHLERRLGPFRASSDPGVGTRTLHVDVSCDPRHAALPLPEGVAFPGCAAAREASGVLVFRGLGFELRFDETRANASVRTTPTMTATPDDRTMVDTALRLLLSYVLPSHDGILLHACGYADQRGAVVFPGLSDEGKTTTARKLPPAGVLSDDQVALRRVDGVWHAYSLPFVGEYGTPTHAHAARLRSILVLEKAVGPARRSKLAHADAVGALMACAPWYVPGDGGLRTLLDTCFELAAAEYVQTLLLGRDEPVMPVVDEVLECPPG